MPPLSILVRLVTPLALLCAIGVFVVLTLDADEAPRRRGSEPDRDGP